MDPQVNQNLEDFNVITSNDLVTPSSQLSPVPFSEPPVPEPTIDSLIADFDQQQNALNEQLFEAQREESGLLGDITGIIEQQGQEAPRRQQLLEEQGVIQDVENLSDLMGELKVLQAQRQSIPLEVQEESAGRLRTKRATATITAQKQRQNAIQILQTSALAQATQGNIQTANTLINEALNAEFEPLEAELRAKYIQYENNRETLQKIDVNKARIAENRLNLQLQQVAQNKANKETIYNTALRAQEFGADPSVIKAILNSKTPEQALFNAGSSVQDPRFNIQLEQLRLDNVYRSTQIQMLRKQMEILALEEGIAEGSDITEQNGQREIAEKALLAIQGIKDSGGISTRVGPSVVARKGVTGKEKVGRGIINLVRATIPGLQVGLGQDIFSEQVTGNADAFTGYVKNLTSQETLNQLINVKNRGATFGALSNQELQLLVDSASVIASWELKDENGVGLGVWDIDEQRFKDEIFNLEQYYQKALGEAVLDSDINNILDTVYEEQEQLNFNPAF